MHRDAAIDGAPEVMHPDLSVGAVDRHLGDAGDLRAGIVDVCHANTAAVALLAPVRHLRHPLEHLDGAWGVLQQLEPELHRVDTALERDFVDEGLGRELVGGEADPAQRVRAHTGVTIELFHQLVRNVITARLAAEHGNEVLAAAHLVAHRIHVGPDAVHGDAVMPRRELAGGIEAGLQIMGRDGAEAATVDVVLACPHDLHRSPRLFRQQHGVDDEIDVAVAATAETAAHQHVVKLHLVARNAEDFGRRLARDALALRSGPDFD